MKEFEALYPIAKEVLQQLNLFSNYSKTESPRFVLLKKNLSKVMNPGKAGDDAQ